MRLKVNVFVWKRIPMMFLHKNSWIGLEQPSLSTARIASEEKPILIGLLVMKEDVPSLKILIRHNKSILEGFTSAPGKFA